MSSKTVYKGHPNSKDSLYNQEPPSSPRTRRRNLQFPAPGEIIQGRYPPNSDCSEVRYHSSSEVIRYHAPNPGSPSPGSCGTLGPGTLEVLYEDPKEDQVSLLSQEEDDKRRLLSPKKMEDSHWDQKEEETWEAWKNLQEEIRDIHTLIVEFSNMVVVSYK